MTEQVFKKVWLTHQPPKMGIKPNRHTGTLTLSDAGLQFIAKNHQFRVPRGYWRVVGTGTAGSDIVNSWAHFVFTDTYGQQGEAWVNDGRFLGWGGIFGGVKKLQRALAQ